MSTIVDASTRAVVVTRNRLALRGEHGQATSEWAVVMLVAVGLALAVLEIVTGGILNTVLGDLLKKVLQTAIGKIH